ncbi:DUF192 domain-containing protein [Ramlibacter henchirensis]|uniref:DUF192 domain-containing protein n=1 Tax=Ramlibacter henchirensis TaxID=204072 RepID=A0A4Z0BPW5_9BURK|nr:DUF192 domain-containing protein [Ramlibacter henchirensis]TFZ00812.1 DUF192 domain-containing protein [Ramlibacter henchirensis]
MRPARIALALLLAAAPAFAQEEPQTDLPRVELSAGMHKIEAQIARTPSQTATGLMWRKQMPQHEGMLFVFPQAFPQCFWMKNTLLPLSAAFIEDDGTIVNIADMQAQSLESHCSLKPVRYVLEMNQGWFAKRGIKPGMKLAGPPFQR